MRQEIAILLPFPTRNNLLTGEFTADSLGNAQVPEKIGRRIRRRACKVHSFRRGKWFFRCVNCGHIEDFAQTSRLGLESAGNAANN